MGISFWNFWNFWNLDFFFVGAREEILERLRCLACLAELSSRFHVPHGLRPLVFVPQLLHPPRCRRCCCCSKTFSSPCWKTRSKTRSRTPPGRLRLRRSPSRSRCTTQSSSRTSARHSVRRRGEEGEPYPPHRSTASNAWASHFTWSGFKPLSDRSARYSPRVKRKWKTLALLREVSARQQKIMTYT
jgi:hypothetical protein